MELSRAAYVSMNGDPRTSPRSLFTILLRVVLGIVFVYASFGKIASPDAFASSIGNYGVFPPTSALFVATILPWVELLSGLGLLLGVYVRGSALLTLVMLVAFTTLVVSAMARGLDISCGCYTQDPSVDTIGWRKLIENLFLIAANILVYRTPGPAKARWIPARRSP